MEENGIELNDYLKIIWKRKWVIVIGTIACIIITGVISFIIKPVYEIDTIIQPGKFFVQDQAGRFNEFVVEHPQQIADKVKHNSYNALIASELGIEISRIPEIDAENIRDTLLTRIWIRSQEVNLGEKILNSLLTFVKAGIDEKIEIEIADIDATIKGDEIEKGRILQQIEIINNKIKNIEQRKRDILEEMKSVKSRQSQLEKEQLKFLNKETRSEMEILSMLLYSNEIQESLRDYDILNEKLFNERLRVENLNSDLHIERARIEQLDTTIANLKERKGRIDYTRIVKDPTPSVDPIFPKKRLNILIAGFFGLIVFIMLVMFLESIAKKKPTS
jgi:uncharacterized protein involved in exopolysaccharide biosynthesis